MNVTNLLLARASSRSRESAVRTALGATRADLLRERITESLVYSVGGTFLGIAVARWMIAAVQSIDPRGIPRLAEVGLNLPVLAFAAAVAVVTGLAAGILPALAQPFADVAHALRPSHRGAGDAGHTRLRNALVVAEVSLSLVLLIGTGLLVRSLLNVLTVDRGFQTDNRMLITLSIPSSYEPSRMEQETKQVMERIGTISGVVSVAAVSGRPLSPGSTGMGIAAADKPDVSGADVPWATWRIVTTDYFKVMGIPLIAGRAFTDSEQLGKPWRVVISKRTAELLWPGEPADGFSRGPNQIERIATAAAASATHR